MVIPTRDSNRFWILKFIVCFLISGVTAFAIFRTVLSFPKASDINYELPIHGFFPLFIPALTGVVVNFLCFASKRDREDEEGAISRFIRFGISGCASILTTFIASFFPFNPELFQDLKLHNYIYGFGAFTVTSAGLIGGLSSILFRSSILEKFLISLILISCTFIFSFNPFLFIVTYQCFYGAIFVSIVDEWLDFYSKLLIPKVPRFYTILSFILMMFLAMTVAIWTAKKVWFCEGVICVFND